MKKTWQEKLKDKPSFPKVLRLDKGLPCYQAAHEISVARGLYTQTRALLCLYK